MKIYTIAHKHIDLFKSPIRQPLFVGAYRVPEDSRNPQWEYDDACQNNISKMNSLFCELTGLRYIAETATDDVIGIEHYRRYLHVPDSMEPLSEEQIYRELESCDCLVADLFPCSIKFDLRKCTVAQQYDDAHSLDDLLAVQKIIESMCDESYSRAMEEVLNRESFHPCNIVICKNETFKSYCSWLFDVLDKAERKIDIFHGRDEYQSRVFGFLSERLLDVWLCANDLSVKTFPLFDPLDASVKYSDSLDVIEKRLDNPSVEKGYYVYEGLDFAPVFDADFYLAHNNDLDNPNGVDGQALFGHFLDHGVTDGRWAHPDVRMLSYSAYHYDVREQCRGNVVETCRAYVEDVSKKGRRGHHNIPYGYCEYPYDYVYDFAYYLGKYKDELPDDAMYDTRAVFNHFLNTGMEKGYQANALFCPQENITPEERAVLDEGGQIDWKAVYLRHMKNQPLFRQSCCGRRMLNRIPRKRRSPLL